ncbi:MAG: helix-turn-helix transcriptional regulator [Leptospirillum sp.]|jgi:transcriptional regulator with XRE-family HTH domain
MQENHLAQKIKDYLTEQGLTQTQLAKKAGVSQSSVSNIRKDKSLERMGIARRKLQEFFNQSQLSNGVEEDYPNNMITDASSKLIEALTNFESVIKTMSRKININE